MKTCKILGVLLAIAMSSSVLGASRDTERLSRDGDGDTGAVQQAGSAELGITTSEYRSNGWISNGVANGTSPWIKYTAAELAISSSGCQQDSNRWRKAYAKCLKQGFEPVHLYLALDTDSETEIEALAAKDSWSNISTLEHSVVRLSGDNKSTIAKAVVQLIEECKVIDYVFVDSHGASEILAVGEDQIISVSSFIGYVLSPCYLSPRAKVQFAGCNVACGQGAENIRSALERRFDDIRQTRDPKSPEAFTDVKLLLNTDAGYVGWAFGYGPLEHIGVRSDNDLAMVYTIKGSNVTTDFPTAQAPACPKHEWPTKVTVRPRNQMR